MALQALVILDGGVGLLLVFFPIELAPQKMGHNVFDPMEGLGIEEVPGILGRGQVAIHTIGHKTHLIIGMLGGPPGVIGKFDFMARGAKMRGGGAHHGVIGEAEKGEGYDNAENYQESRL